MSDLISRQGMCDSLNKYRIEKTLEGKDVSLVWECIDKVLQEPSAQPLIDAICPHYIRNEHDRGDDSLCRKFQCEVSALPRKGRWLIKPHKMMGEAPCCSECGAFEPIKRRFCPNCGADMRGREDDELQTD